MSIRSRLAKLERKQVSGDNDALERALEYWRPHVAKEFPGETFNEEAALIQRPFTREEAEQIENILSAHEDGRLDDPAVADIDKYIWHSASVTAVMYFFRGWTANT